MLSNTRRVLALSMSFGLIAGSAGAEDFSLSRDIPGNVTPPPRVDIHEYAVYFAFPAQTAWFVLNERGAQRGPYDSYEEAYEAGMEQQWILFDVEELELPQTWFFRERYGTRTEADNEAQWLRAQGFDAEVEPVPELRRR